MISRDFIAMDDNVLPTPKDLIDVINWPRLEHQRIAEVKTSDSCPWRPRLLQVSRAPRCALHYAGSGELRD